MGYGVVGYDEVRCSTVLYGLVRHSGSLPLFGIMNIQTWWGEVWCGTVWYTTVRSGEALCGTAGMTRCLID